MADFTSQSKFSVRFDWAAEGISALLDAEAFVIVDVLSFCTSVSIVTEGGGAVYPFVYKDDRVEEFAAQVGAVAASPSRSLHKLSLSPQSLIGLGPRELVLPSPNGSELTTHITRRAPEAVVYAASLRNAHAAARALEPYSSVAIIAAGERWPNGTTRFAIEDLIGAGAVIHYLSLSKSPEAIVAEAAFVANRDRLEETLLGCASGRELVERGFETDVRIASALDASDLSARLVEGRFISVEKN